MVQRGCLVLVGHSVNLGAPFNPFCWETIREGNCYWLTNRNLLTKFNSMMRWQNGEGQCERST